VRQTSRHCDTWRLSRPLAISVLAVASCCIAGTLVAQITNNDIDFEKQIRPLLIDRCAECHGPDDQTSDLRLDAKHAFFKGGSSGPVVVTGDSAGSELIRRITTDDPDQRMPPEGPALPEAEVRLLRRWSDDGANWPESDYDREAARDPRREHWAFQKVRKIALPDAAIANGTANPIDYLVGRRLKENGLNPSPAADRRTLIRRLSMDLWGLPPTPEQVETFVTDRNPDAFSKLVDRMLASPRYGERWAQHWLDLVRYADTHGFEVNTSREHAWPYRDYVIRAFNEDKPYDQFVKEQIAGDAFAVDEATGFLVAAPVLLPGQIGKDDESRRLARQDALDEIIIGTSATFMALTIGCARCHDHKFDPISQRDYYALQAFFAGVHYGDRPIRQKDHQQKLVKARKIGEQIRKLEMQLRKLEPRVSAGRTLVIDEQDEKLATSLKKHDTLETNPQGTDRGYADDCGSANRLANISGGYTFWWKQIPGEDLLTYQPRVSGRFQLWISWGARGGDSHTSDARYVLDADGDLETTDDQTEIAQIDQRRFAGAGDTEPEQEPLWSGLHHAGIIHLNDESKIILRSGETGPGISADAIVVQELDGNPDQPAPHNLPYLRAPVNARVNAEPFEAVPARFIRFNILETTNNNRYEPCIDELEIYGPASPQQNIALASNGAIATSSGNYSETGKHQLKHVNDGVYGNDRSWISSEHGAGWVQIELPEVSRINRIVWGRDRNEEFADRLAVRYRIEVSMDGTKWQTVADHTDRQPYGSPYSLAHSIYHRMSANDAEYQDVQKLLDNLSQLRTGKLSLEEQPLVYAGVFREPEATYLLRRGDPEQKLDRTAPATPEFLGGILLTVTESEQNRRVRLAEWIASADNPLTARVMVNRIWQYHFGRGLVNTPSDFGLNGQRPSHPDLLDWMAGEFIRHDWSVKHIQRLIVSSRTYQQASTTTPASAQQDDQWLWRYPSRRIEAEAIRDSMLSISGELNLKMGGPGFDFFTSRGGLNGFPPVVEFQPDGLRRMIYAHKVRMETTPVFGAFDCPDAGQPMPGRGQSTTAIQALNLFNSQFVIKRANQFAARVRAERPDSLNAQIERAFELALGRSPRRAESGQALKLCTDFGLESLCRVLFNANEFLFIQ
jgi:hypothetical protein